MKLIVGLGNPGEKYAKNRHNVGFQFLDFVIEKFQNPNPKLQISNQFQNQNLKFKNNKYLQSEIVLFHDLRYAFRVSRFALHDLLLAKPQTFMNKSGLAVSRLVTRFALHVSRDLIIVHDDLDIPLGKFKIQTGTGPQLHNGIESIEQALKTKEFLRIRIGIDSRKLENQVDGEARHKTVPGKTRRRMVPGELYVLQNFTEEEKTRLYNNVFPKILTRIKQGKIF